MFRSPYILFSDGSDGTIPAGIIQWVPVGIQTSQSLKNPTKYKKQTTSAQSSIIFSSL